MKTALLKIMFTSTNIAPALNCSLFSQGGKGEGGRGRNVFIVRRVQRHLLKVYLNATIHVWLFQCVVGQGGGAKGRTTRLIFKGRYKH